MKNIILRNGLIASVIVIVPSLFLLILGGGATPENMTMGEIVGYASILLAMIFVFFGIKKYRDEHQDGIISFWEALKVGLLITLVPSVAFGLYNVLYVEFLDPNFMENYLNYLLEQERVRHSAEEFARIKAEIEQQQAMFGSAWVQFIVMFLTIFIIGFVASFIFSWILKREKLSIA